MITKLMIKAEEIGVAVSGGFIKRVDIFSKGD